MELEDLHGPECVKGKHKTRESKGILEQLKRLQWAEVSQIQVQTDTAENQRRQIEEKRKAERYNTIRNEMIHSSTKNEAAQLKWDELVEIEECEELFTKIQDMKRECEAILDSKNQLIVEFLGELKDKDAFYVKSVESQEKDIRTVLGAMQSQHCTLREEYSKQLGDIETAYLAERDALLRTNKQVIDDLFKRHRELEVKFTNERQDEEDMNTQNLEDTRDEEANKLHQTKVLVESNLQTLETYMEEMKAVYQLNLEKLDYNTKLLAERGVEKDITKSELTKRERNLKNIKSNLKAKVKANEAGYMKANAQLTDKFKKMSRAFNELRKKFRHFEKADTQKFSEIWAMNELEVKDLANKVLKCDKIIYQQQLGLDWAPPEDNLELGSTSEHLEPEPDGHSAPSPPIARIKEVFKLLVAECAFLLEDKVKDHCIGLPTSEQFTLQIDSIRKTVGVETMEDVQELVRVFYAHSTEEGELNVHHSNVIELLAEFQDLKAERKHGGSLSRTEPFAVTSFAGESDKERRQKALLEERKHWERVGNLLPENHLRTWRALEKSLTQYYELLQERQNLVEETGVLHHQNEELKSLLQQYLQAGVNNELQVPPTQMLRIGDEEPED